MIVSALLFCAAIPGVPEQRPDTIGAYSFAWSNDWFAYPMALNETENDPMDDFRTNAFAGSARFGRWIYALDDSMLTSKALGLRADEITATVGYDLGLGTIGVGARSRRDYRGQEMQNTWHRWLHDVPLHLDRETTGEQAVLYVLADLPGLDSGETRWQPIASGMIASDGESTLDVGELFVIRGERFTIYCGPRLQLRDGAGSELTRKIEAHERGLAAQYGFARHHGFAFDVTIMPGEWSGVLSWSF